MERGTVFSSSGGIGIELTIFSIPKSRRRSETVTFAISDFWNSYTPTHSLILSPNPELPAVQFEKVKQEEQFVLQSFLIGTVSVDEDVL
jgi:hypothetical protein